jgi:heptosyltransferase II
MRKYVFKKPWMRALAAFIDAAGGAIYPLFKKQGGAPALIKKIAVIRLDQMGDIVQAIPFFAALRKKNPGAEITAVCASETSFLLKNNPDINTLITTDNSWFYKGKKSFFYENGKLGARIREGGFDLAYDLRGDARNILMLRLAGVKRITGYGCTGLGFLLDEELPYDREEHEIDKNLKLMGERSGHQVKIFISPSVEDARAAAQALDKAKGKKIVIHPFAGSDSKMWGLDKFGSLAEMITEADGAVSIFIIGGKADAQAAEMVCSRVKNAVNCAGVLTPGAAVSLIQNSGVFIGNDSGPQYFAAYLGIKTCVIAGYTSNYERWRPKTDPRNLIVIRKEVPCGPCELGECSEPQHRCMDEISVNEVFDKIKLWI